MADPPSPSRTHSLSFDAKLKCQIIADNNKRTDKTFLVRLHSLFSVQFTPLHGATNSMSILIPRRSKDPSSASITQPERSRNADHYEPLLVNPKVAWKMLGCGNTRGYQLLAAGKLASFLDGRSRKIVVQSIYHYIARRLDESAAAESQPKRRRGRPPKTLGAPAVK